MAALGRLRVHHDFQDQLRKRATARWHDNDLVFAFRVGTTLYAGNVSPFVPPVLAVAGPSLADWTSHELRHSFVSYARRGYPYREDRPPYRPPWDGHTDTVYRKQIRPVVMGCAQVADSLFPAALAYADPCQCVSENWVCETMCFMQKTAL